MPIIDPKAYRFDYKNEIAQAMDMFPQAREQIFFVETHQQLSPTNIVYECFGPAWERHKDNPDSLKSLRGSVGETLAKCQARAVRGIKNPDLKYIVLYFHRMGRPALDMCFTFDHELGHQLTTQGFGIHNGDELRGESAADAFAGLRFIQRFGRAAGSRLLAQKSADRLIAPMTSSHYEADWVHLTAAVLARIVKEAAATDFEHLTPAATIETADRIARDYAPTDGQMQKYWDNMRGKSTYAGTAPAVAAVAPPVSYAAPRKTAETWNTAVDWTKGAAAFSTKGGASGAAAFGTQGGGSYNVTISTVPSKTEDKTKS